MLRKAAFAGFSTIAFFGMLEVAARVGVPDVPPNAFPHLQPSEQPDPRYLWSNRRHAPETDVDGPIDAHGFRGEPLKLEKPTGGFRILSLGESSTYGHGVHWKKTYSHVLSEILASSGRRVEVVNAGVRGWSSYQSTLFLRDGIDSIDPDLVLFYHENNDFLPTTWRGIDVRGAGLNDVELIEIVRGGAPWRWCLERSRLFSWLRLALARWRLRGAIANIAEGARGADVLSVFSMPYVGVPATALGEPRPWMDDANPVVRLPDPLRAATLQDLVALTRGREVDLVFLHPVYLRSRRHDCLQTRIAREEGVPVLDLEDAILAAAAARGTRKDDFFIPRDVFHPNPAGHEVIARAIAAFLEETGLLPE